MTGWKLSCVTALLLKWILSATNISAHFQLIDIGGFQKGSFKAKQVTSSSLFFKHGANNIGLYYTRNKIEMYNDNISACFPMNMCQIL